MPAEPARLDHIRVRFATFRDQSIEERTAHAVRLTGLATSERVLLDTCHRVELVSVDDDTTGPMLTGREAIRRVFTVVAGFDSAVVAEEQLLGQARGAYEAALADGSTGPILNELFQRALRFGRRVRTHARPGTDRSLADRGAGWLLERLGGDASRVVVAGTGEMGRLTALRIAESGHLVTVVSRSADRGGQLLELLPGGGHRLVVGALTPASIGESEAVVLAVRTREPILTASLVEAAGPKWTVDLSTPPAVARDAETLLGEQLMSVDRLGTLSSALPVLAAEVERRLRAEIEEEVDRFVAWLDVRRSADALAVLHGEADAVRRRHLDRLRRRARLAPEQLAEVEAASAAMVGELLHGPTVELRRGGADAATVRRLFGLDA